MIIKSTNSKLNGKNLFTEDFIKQIKNLPKVRKVKLQNGSPIINGQSPAIDKNRGTIKSFASDGPGPDGVDGNVIWFLLKHKLSPYLNEEEQLIEDLGIDSDTLDIIIENRYGKWERYNSDMFVKEIITKLTFDKLKSNPKTITNGNIDTLIERKLTSETIEASGVIDISKLNEEDLDFEMKEIVNSYYKIIEKIDLEFQRLKTEGKNKQADFISLYKSKVELLIKYKTILKGQSQEKEIDKSLEIISEQMTNKLEIMDKNDKNRSDINQIIESTKQIVKDITFKEDFQQITSSVEHPILFPYQNQISGNKISIVAGTKDRKNNSKYKMINTNTFDVTNVGNQAKRIFIVEGKMDELSLKQMLKEQNLLEQSNILTVSNVNTATTKEVKNTIKSMLQNNQNIEDIIMLLDQDQSGREATEHLISNIYDDNEVNAYKIKKGTEVLKNIGNLSNNKITDINELLIGEKQEEFLSKEHGLLSNKYKVQNPGKEKKKIKKADKDVMYFKNQKELISYITFKQKDKKGNITYKFKFNKYDTKKRFLIKSEKDIKEISFTELQGIQDIRKEEEEKSKVENKVENLIKTKKKANIQIIESGKNYHHNLIYGIDPYGDKIEECFFVNEPSTVPSWKKIYNVDLNQVDTEDKTVKTNLRRIVYEGITKVHELELNKEEPIIEVEKEIFGNIIEDFSIFKEWWLEKTNKKIDSIKWEDKSKAEKAKKEVEKELELIKLTYDNFNETKQKSLLEYFLSLNSVINTYKNNGIFSQIRGSAPSFTSFDLMGYTNLPDTHIETKLGEIKELMPPERFMSQYKFSMADVDIEVSSQNKQKAVELLNKKGFFLFLVKKELQGGEVQIALHPCKMIDVPKKYRKYITGKTKIIPLSKEDLSKEEIEKAFDILNQKVGREENIDLNEENINGILDDIEGKIRIQDIIVNDLPQVTYAAKEMLLKYKGLKEEKIPTKTMYGGLKVFVLNKEGKDKKGEKTSQTLIDYEGKDITSSFNKYQIENKKSRYININNLIGDDSNEIIKKLFPIEFNNNIDFLNSGVSQDELMTATASNRPAFTGELLTFEGREYYFSIKNRELINIENGEILERKKYPVETKNQLLEYFEKRYPIISNKETGKEEDFLEIEINEDARVPSSIKRRQVLDYIIEHKQTRKYFTNLNITGGAILFQEQMTSYLVKIAKEYINQKTSLSEEEKEKYILDWKRKGDICQSFVKKTADSLTNELIEEAINIFNGSKDLLKEIENKEFVEEAMNIFKTQFFAFENGAYLYNGAHGEMVSYNAIQELLFLTKRKDIKKRKEYKKNIVNKEEIEEYNQRKTQEGKEQEEYQGKIKNQEKIKYENSDFEWKLEIDYYDNHKYINQTTQEEIDAIDENGNLIILNELKEGKRKKDYRIEEVEGRIALKLLFDLNKEDKKLNKIFKEIKKHENFKNQSLEDLKKYKSLSFYTKSEKQKNFQMKKIKEITDYIDTLRVKSLKKEEVEKEYKEIFSSQTQKSDIKYEIRETDKNKIIGLQNFKKEELDKLEEFLLKTFPADTNGKRWTTIFQGKSISLFKSNKYTDKNIKKITDFIENNLKKNKEKVEETKVETQKSDINYEIKETDKNKIIGLQNFKKEELDKLEEFLLKTFPADKNGKRWTTIFQGKSISLFKSNKYTDKNIKKITDFIESNLKKNKEKVMEIKVEEKDKEKSSVNETTIEDKQNKVIIITLENQKNKKITKWFLNNKKLTLLDDNGLNDKYQSKDIEVVDLKKRQQLDIKIGDTILNGVIVDTSVMELKKLKIKGAKEELSFEWEDKSKSYLLLPNKTYNLILTKEQILKTIEEDKPKIIVKQGQLKEGVYKVISEEKEIEITGYIFGNQCVTCKNHYDICTCVPQSKDRGQTP